MIIRQLRERDLEAVTAIEHSMPDAWTAHYIDSEMMHSRTVGKVVTQNGTIRGWCMHDVRFASGVIHLRRIVIDPEFRGVGLGSLLLDDLKQKARGQPVPWLVAQIAEHQYEAAPFFRKHGFAVSERNGELLDASGAFWMKLELGVPDGVKGVLA